VGLVVPLSSLTESARVHAETFVRMPTQFIAALAEPTAKSGTGAENWGLWRIDPGPRGVWATSYRNLMAGGGIAPAGWQFDANDWWLDENGLLMEHPEYGLAPGKYLVTGRRETTAVLTVHPKDAEGSQRWELDGGATIYDVTHLRCRSARYRPVNKAALCTPERAPLPAFPVEPGASMPAIEGCQKQDYTVLFIVGRAVTE
jgi:hypothetical protein